MFAVEIHDVSEGATKKVELIMSKPNVEYIDEYPARPLQVGGYNLELE